MPKGKQRIKAIQERIKLVFVFAISNAILSDISLRCFLRADDLEIRVVADTDDKVLFGALSFAL